MKPHLLSLLVLAAGACATPPIPPGDPHQWLEEVEAPAALDWVDARNAQTYEALTESDLFSTLQAEATAILTNEARIPEPAMIGDHIYNFWQDDTHVRGIWRRTDKAAFDQGAPAWETVIDVDALAESEAENWVFEGVSCYGAPSDRCMVELSKGGKDSTIYREFSLATRDFVEDGFVVPEAKSYVSWRSPDQLLVATDWGEGALTDAGYPRDVRLWDRGTALDTAASVYVGETDDTLVAPVLYRTADKDYAFVARVLQDWNRSQLFRLKEGGTEQVALPEKASAVGVHDERLIVSLGEDWAVDGTDFSRGDILALPLTGDAPELVFRPGTNQAASDAALTEAGVLVSLLEDVKGKLLMMKRTGADWTGTAIPMPDTGTIKLVASSVSKPDAYVTYESFTQPNALYRLPADLQPQKLFQLPALYDASNVDVAQRWAISADGERIPYFLIGQKEVLQAGNAPAILYAYGGFEAAMTPIYYENPGRPQHGALAGKMWISRGGVLAIANLRGGGEFGPRWHQAALRENRQRAFDDYYAVAEDMIAAGITSSDRLGALGRSNGGLLLGAALTQQTDLFAAYDIGVPLFDMIAYTGLGAGASWIGEYGDPRVPEDRLFIEKYSPYQNLDPDTDYPPVLIYTSTQDDRVHPGHARKATARLEEYGNKVFYYENREGGHGGTANQDQLAFRTALEYAYFFHMLMDRPEE